MPDKSAHLIEDYELNGLGFYLQPAVISGCALEKGANVVLLENTVLGASLLRSPDSAGSYNRKSSLYGIPVLSRRTGLMSASSALAAGSILPCE